jgi:zinc protease
MIDYQHFTLDNGLKVYVQEDPSVGVAVFNLMYNVGSRDEGPTKTGFAHLFEHLMFGGSMNIPDYDKPLQRVGASNNAFTSPDMTNYYVALPANNIETAFWLESDRMLSLNFDPKVLEVQRKVVIEEFNQRYLNQPYGDVWLHLRPLAYKKHPYRWATIGKEISHIEQAKMDDVKEIFFKFYRPNNAVLSIVGNVKVEHIKKLAQKWFGDIPMGNVPTRQLPKEDKQTSARFLEIEKNVPLDVLYKAYPMCNRMNQTYYQTDLLSDVLGRGHSSRLYQKLVKEKNIFTSVGAFITGSFDEGLLLFSGKPQKGVSLEEADAAISGVVEEFKKEGVGTKELERVKNQAESSLVYDKIQLLNRAIDLCSKSILGNVALVNEESERVQAVTGSQIQEMAKKILSSESSNTLYYKAKKD